MDSQPRSDPPDQTNVIAASTVTAVVILVIAIAIVTIIVCVTAKKYGGSKVILQVTGDSMNVLNGATPPSIILHRYIAIHMMHIMW